MLGKTFLYLTRSPTVISFLIFFDSHEGYSTGIELMLETESIGRVTIKNTVGAVVCDYHFYLAALMILEQDM
jgi:hypothetical protein